MVTKLRHRDTWYIVTMLSSEYIIYVPQSSRYDRRTIHIHASNPRTGTSKERVEVRTRTQKYYVLIVYVDGVVLTINNVI